MNQSNSQICAKCKTPNEAGARFCEMCGSPLPGKPPDIQAQGEFTAPFEAAPVETWPQQQVRTNVAAGRKPASKSWVFWLLGAAALLLVFCVAAAGLFLLLKPDGALTRILGSESSLGKNLEEIDPSQQADKKTTQSGSTRVTETKSSATITPRPAEATEALQPSYQIAADRKKFYCISSDGPTTLGISVTGAAGPALVVRWRLNDKVDGRTTDWEDVEMKKTGSDQYSFTFDANTWDGTNNFYYPAMMHESWFEYQVTARDGSYRSEVIKDVTFFPCAQ